MGQIFMVSDVAIIPSYSLHYISYMELLWFILQYMQIYNMCPMKQITCN